MNTVLKILKALLGLISFLLASIIGYSLFKDLTMINGRNESTTFYIITLTAVILSALSLVYHFKSFYLLRRLAKPNFKKKRELEKSLWIGPYGLGTGLLLLGIFGLFEESSNPSSTQKELVVLLLTFFFTTSFWIIFEAWNMRKRYLNSIRPNENDIDEIGNN